MESPMQWPTHLPNVYVYNYAYILLIFMHDSETMRTLKPVLGTLQAAPNSFLGKKRVRGAT